MFAGRKILVGVTASIAAYKSALLVRELVKSGAEVRVVMTPSAAHFVTPLTLATLSRADVISEMFPDNPGEGTWHIHLGMWADAMIIAPASANTIARLAHGFADTALCSLALALRAPLLVAPAMDTDMYVHPATQENLDILRRRGVTVIPPEEGELASGLSGPGRLPEIPVLLDALASAMTVRDCEGLRVLVSAGPTREALDPVRYLGNRSSGKMGAALVRAAFRRGARTAAVCGPIDIPLPASVIRIDVETAEEMAGHMLREAMEADIVIMAAAVADFRPAAPSLTKIKKEHGSEAGLTLELERTPDILAAVARQSERAVVVGFALETDDGLENARRKLVAKGCDMIVLNNPRDPGSGFGSDTNRVTFLFQDGTVEELPVLSKDEVAEHIIDRALALRAARGDR